MRIVNSKVTNTIQILGTLIHVLNLNMELVPEENRMTLLAAVAGIQAVAGVLQAYHNPDGTKAVDPWCVKRNENVSSGGSHGSE